MRKPALVLAASLLLISKAGAVLPGEQLSDPKLEARARVISAELRCVVCQNQTIDDSDAPLAHDLRLLVRERLLKGDTDQQVEAYIVRRYGTFVLLKPPFQSDTLVLWLGPLAALLAGALGAVWYIRSRNTRAPLNDLSADDERRIDRALDST